MWDTVQAWLDGGWGSSMANLLSLEGCGGDFGVDESSRERVRHHKDRKK